LLRRLVFRLHPAVFIAALLLVSFLAPPGGGSTSLGQIKTLSACVGYPYGGTPTISSVSPSSGRQSGFDVVTITGCGFSGATAVQFGGTDSPDFIVASNTKIIAATPAHAPGTVDVTVTAPSGTTAITAADHFTYVVDSNTQPCRNASIQASSTRQEAGTSIEYIAHSTTCSMPQYKFWLRTPAGRWSVRQDWSISPIFDLNTANFAAGVYKIVVWVTQNGHPLRGPETYAVSTLTLTGCTTVALSQSSTVSKRGVDVHISFNARGCSSPVYKLFLRDPRGRWHVLQTGPTNTYTWHTGTYARGLYRIVVWANQGNSYMARPQAYRYRDHLLT
jgi:hypothetical protein